MRFNTADYLIKAKKCELHSVSASNELLRDQFYDIANQWRKLAEQADKHAVQNRTILHYFTSTGRSRTTTPGRISTSRKNEAAN
jgi:hypothetical protein